MCKTNRNARNDILSSVFCNTAWQNVQRKPRNWIYKNELIDFGGQNETRYNRISFLVLLQLTFEKTTENKSEELICKNQSESNKSNYSSPCEEILLRPQRDESGKSNLFRDQSYFYCVIGVHLLLFFVCLVVTK